MGGMKNLGRGLAAGMTVFGQGIINKEVREEDKRRFDEQSARAERQLQIQEKAAADAAKMAELNLSMKRVQYNNKMLVNAVKQNDYDPTVTMNALNNYGPTGGRIFKKNEAESSKTGGIVWDVGTYRMTKEGNPELNDDGTFAWDPLPGDSGRVSFKDKAELAQWVTPQLAPDVMLATDLAGITGEQTRQQANERFKKQATEDAEFLAKYADTPAGQKILAAQEKEKAELAKTKAETKLATSKAGLANAQAKQIPKEAKQAKGEDQLKSLNGELVTRTKGQAQQDLEVFRKAGAKYSDVTSPQQAYWINEVKENPDVRKNFEMGVTKVINGDMTEAEFLKKVSSKGLSREFAAEFLAQAQADSEEWKKAQDKPGLFKRTWNTIFN